MAKVWKDYPNTSTPITAAALNDLERRVDSAVDRSRQASEAVGAGISEVKRSISALQAATRTLTTTDWQPLTLGYGWRATPGHTPRARLINGLLQIEGAATRGGGGAVERIVQLPPALRPGKATFIGATFATRGSATSACELIASADGWIAVSGYHALDGNINWIIPISCVTAFN